MTKFLTLLFFVFLSVSIPASVSYARFLTIEEIDRIRVVEQMLGGVDKKSSQQAIAEVEKARHPLTALEVKEAMAKAYIDIAKEFNVEAEGRKEWLYSMVCLNMAYLQFGGQQGPAGSTTELNRLIRKKLMQYLPADILKQPGFLYSLS